MFERTTAAAGVCPASWSSWGVPAGMAPPAATSSSTAGSVAQLLNGAQDSAAASTRCAGALWKTVLGDPDAAFDALIGCVNHLLAVSQSSPHVDRCVRFFGLFAAKAPDTEVGLAVLEELLKHAAGHLGAADKGARLRACQLLQQLLAGLPAGLLLDEAVLAELAGALQQRLQDKLPAVRAEAATALCRLIAASASDDEATDGLVEAALALLESDKSKDVRIAVVATLPLNAASLPHILRRARDVSPQVRKALVARLGSLSLRVLSIEQRAGIIQQLLRDRDAGVADAAGGMLAHWLEQDCGGDPLLLLQLLDVESYADAAVCAVDSLISTDSIQAPEGCASRSASRGGAGGGAMAFIRAAASRGGGGGSRNGLLSLRQMLAQEGALLQPHEALMWRALCEWLRSDAISRGLAAAATGGARAAVQAAVAAERHEVLEQVLPDSAADMLQLVMRHAAAGPGARFATAQLLLVAADCMEWTDAASRDVAAPCLQQLLALTPCSEAQSVPAPAGAAEDSQGMQLAGAGGDGAFEAAVAALVMAVQGSPSSYTAAMLDGVASLAAAAGVLRKPGGAADGERFSVGAADSSQLLQLLCHVRLMLQRLPCGCADRDVAAAASSCGRVSMACLWELLLALALKQDNPLVRAKAVECAGLHALAHIGSTPGLLTSAVCLLGPLVGARGPAAVKAAAVKALSDVALLCGPAAVDAILRLPAAGRAAPPAPDSEQRGRGASPADCLPGGNKCLLELLTEQAEGLLSEAQAAPAPSRAKRRAAAASEADGCGGVSAASAELFAVLAESLAKLLLHQRAWLRQNAPPAGAGAGTSASAAADSQQQQGLLLQRALALLLQLQFHPATEAASQLCQCLSVFFDAFAAACEANRLQLAAACLPAARQSLHVAVTKKHPAPLLVKYVLQLLAHTEAEPGSDAPAASTLLGESWGSVGQLMLAEVALVAPITVGAGQQPAKYKPYLSALLKVVAELPLSPPHCSAEEREVLQAMAHSLSVAVTNAALSKDVAALQARLQQLADRDAGSQLAQQLDSAAVESLVQRVCQLSLQQLPALPGGLEGAAAAAAAAAGGAAAAAAAAPERGQGGRRSGSTAAAAGRRSAAAAPAGSRARAAACASDSSDEDDSDDADGSSELADSSDNSGSDGAGGQAAGRRQRNAAAPDGAGSHAEVDGSSSEEDDQFMSADEQEQSPAAAGAAGKAAPKALGAARRVALQPSDVANRAV